MTVYADTSFFFSLYSPDAHSLEARQRISSHPLMWFTPLHRAEFIHAVAQHVFRRLISATEAQKLVRDLERDRVAGLWLETGLPEMALDICADLARRHGARLGVRMLDSLHVASALQLKAKQFWTFDQRQAKLAQAEGLTLAPAVRS